MDKDKKILLFIVLVLVVLASVFGVLAYLKNKDNPIILTDAMQFKKDYEALNGVVNDSNKLKYPEVSIKENNPMKYLTDSEAVEALSSQTGIMYFGFPDCPWCRSMLPMLLKSADSTNLGELYYVNIKDIRDELTLDDNNNVVVKKEGTNGYKALLKAMDAYLDPYELTNKDGKKFQTGEKRLYAPTVVAFKDGKIIDVHVDTVKSQKTGYTPLSDKEQEELFKIYQSMILKIQGSSCNESC